METHFKSSAQLREEQRDDAVATLERIYRIFYQDGSDTDWSADTNDAVSAEVNGYRERNGIK